MRQKRSALTARLSKQTVRSTYRGNAVNPTDGSVPESIEAQTEQSLKNIGAILTEAGYTYKDVVKSTVLLTDMNDFAAMNAVYARFYTEQMPARVCYQVAKLPMGVKVEIETVAVK